MAPEASLRIIGDVGARRGRAYEDEIRRIWGCTRDAGGDGGGGRGRDDGPVYWPDGPQCDHELPDNDSRKRNDRLVRLQRGTRLLPAGRLEGGREGDRQRRRAHFSGRRPASSRGAR